MATACSLLSRFRAIYFPTSRTSASRAFSVRPSPISHLRPLVSVSEGVSVLIDFRGAAGRCFSTRSTTSSIQNPSPNWSNRPPKETILLDGCDFEHWLVVVEKPDENFTRDDIIDSFIKTLAQVVGSEEEARMKIYSVSTKHYFAFGALVSEELSYKIKALPGVRWVLPDSYLYVKNKDYGGEPFIDGQAVPYDPKYHEEWVRNNARANDRPRRRDRPRSYDPRRENMQSRDFQTREAPAMPNFQNAASPAQPGHNAPPQNSSHQMPSNPNAFPNKIHNAQPGYGYQAGPPGNQGYQAGAHGIHGNQSGPGSQGYQASATGSQGYQASATGSQGYQAGPPGGQAYQAGPPGGQAYQASQSVGQGYLAGAPRGQVYQVGQPSGSAPYHGGNKFSQGGPTGGPASSQGNFRSTNYLGGSPSDQANIGYHQGGGTAGFQGGNTGFQGGQPGAAAYQGGNPTNTARDIPGRDF